MKKIKLSTGTLTLKDTLELNSLVSFGSRNNKKRGFFFISKVTGKHLPVKPSKIKDINIKLAKLIPPCEEYTLFIGLAEAASGLGQGVFEEYNSPNSFYLQTTRYKTSKKKLLCFKEEHSHAPSHILYEPIEEALKEKLKKTRRVIIIDDEVSTGNTVNNFIIELKKTLSNVSSFYLYSILDWSDSKYFGFESNSIYKGSFSFEENDFSYDNNIKSITSNTKDLDNIIPHNFSRYGTDILNYNMCNYINIDHFKNKKVLVLGTSEFTYLPYLLALYIEDNNIDTYFQSTTRSPINIDGDIISKINFKDNYSENIDNFLYNVIDKDYDNIIICYETRFHPSNFNLKSQLEKKFNVSEIFFEDNKMTGKVFENASDN